MFDDVDRILKRVDSLFVRGICLLGILTFGFIARMYELNTTATSVYSSAICLLAYIVIAKFLSDVISISNDIGKLIRKR